MSATPSPTCCERSGAVPGIERVRFTSPHPRDFTSEVIAAMAETPTVMPSLHMPLQSGSDQVLRTMRRSYRRDRFLAILDEVRASIPNAAITTDIIVGFPGETEADFADTLEVVERARFSAAFTFQYSPRPGTPAAEMDDQIPKAVVQERYERLVKALERISWEENQRLIGTTAEVLVAEGEGRKDEQTRRLSGRARDGRLVHFSGAESARPGDCVSVVLDAAAPHHLTGTAASIRTTRAGDAWEASQESCGTGSSTRRLHRPRTGHPGHARPAPSWLTWPSPPRWPAVVAIVGPTAVGKSEVALELAQRIGGEVVNADAFQVYRGMDIGTAKVPPAERRGSRTTCVDILDVTEELSVAQYQRDGRAVLGELAAQGSPRRGRRRFGALRACPARRPSIPGQRPGDPGTLGGDAG